MNAGTRNVDPSRAVAVILQHAETSALMGVDFVPCYLEGPEQASIGRDVSHSDDGSTTSGAVAAASLHSEASEAVHPRESGGTADATRESNRAKLELVRERYVADAPHKQFNTTFKNLVFGDGNPSARLMFVGEAPGADEDECGRPFVGRAGQLLDKMIVAMGLRREDVYIANVLKTRPPNNETPTPTEVALCAPYLFDQIDAVGPEVIVTLGLPATKAVLATTIPDVEQRTMGSMRSIWSEFKHPKTGRMVPVMPTYHPAYVLRNYTDETRGKVWSDLKKVVERLGLSTRKRG